MLLTHQNFKRAYILIAATGLILSQLLSSPAQAKVEGGKIKGTVGAWQVMCGRPAGSKLEKCMITQVAVAEDRPNITLVVTFQRPLVGGKLIMLVVAPMGTLLPKGLGLIVDNESVGSVPFLRCGNIRLTRGIGCLAQAVVTDKVKKLLSNGKQAVFTIFPTLEEGIGIPLPIDGFAKAVKEIK